METASTSEAVAFITHVQSLKRKLKSWDKQVEVFKSGQKVLERQRFQFPQGMKMFFGSFAVNKYFYHFLYN